MKLRLPSFLAAFGLAAGLPTNVQALLWDLESIALGSATSVSQANGGVTMTITRPTSSFAIDDISFAIPASWLTHTLSPFEGGSATTAFIAKFSSLVRRTEIPYSNPALT